MPYREFRENLAGRRFGFLVALKVEHGAWICKCDCGQVVRRRAGELNRQKTASCGCKWRKPVAAVVAYRGAHYRVASSLGPARKHSCIDCGMPASQWSYDHADPDEVISEHPQSAGIAYSVKPEHYDPRCVPCHKRVDIDRGRLAYAGESPQACGR